MEMNERLSEAEIVQRVQGHHHPEGEEQEGGQDPDSDDDVSTASFVAGVYLSS